MWVAAQMPYRPQFGNLWRILGFAFDRLLGAQEQVKFRWPIGEVPDT
jgi:hypothetical protein